MVCWPVYIVGGFFISLLLADLYSYEWDLLPGHATLGILITGLFSVFCVLFGNDISLAVLFVPTVFILMFMLTSWLFYSKLTADKCCMTCNSVQESPASKSSTPASENPFADFFTWLFTPPKKVCKTPSPSP
jgi:hypothetical protein